MSHALRRLTPDQYRDWLARHGIAAARVEEVISGYDLAQPLIEEFFEPGDRLFQYIRGSEFKDPNPAAGSWFARAGATPAGLAILEGAAGRRLHRFQVVARFSCIEGSAAKLERNVMKDFGGEGGASQIFVPPMYRGCIRVVGAQDRW